MLAIENNNLERLSKYDDNACNLIDYMHFFMSDFVFDIRRLKPFLTTSLDEVQKASHIVAIYKTIKFTEDNRKRTGKYSKNECYKKYCELLNNEYPTISLYEFKEIFDALSYIRLDSTYLDCTSKSRDSIELLRSKNETVESIIKLLSAIAYRHPNMMNEALAASARNLNGKDIFSFQSDFTNVMKNLRTNREIVDALCYATYNSDCNDVTVENSVVYNLVTSQIGSTKDSATIFIILPTILFIRQFVSDNQVNEKHIIFFLPDVTQSNLLRKSYPYSRTIEFKDISTLEKYMLDGCTPTISVIFGNHFSDETKKCKAASNIIKSAKEQHTLFIFDADKPIENHCFTLHDIISTTSVESVYILPGNINSATSPKRKMLVRCSYGYLNPEEGQIQISQFMLKTNNRDQLLSCKTLQTVLPHSDFVAGRQSLRSIFRAQSEDYYRIGSKTEAMAKSIEFSPEITIYYTFSFANNKQPRLKAYIRDPETKEIVADSILSTTIVPEADAENWVINTYPYAAIKRRNIKIHDVISRTYQVYSHTHNISFKSYLYLCDIPLPGYAKNEYPIFFMFLGDYPLSSITSSHIESFITTNYITSTRKISANQILSVLRRIFDYAVENNYCSHNPATGVHLSEIVDKSEFYNVRSNLSKKFLTKSELSELADFCKLNIQNGHFEYIGILIRAFTGIETNSVVALKWKDLIEIEANGVSLHSLVVRRCTDNKASGFYPFNSLEQRRLIPCTTMLYELIRAELCRQMQEYELAKDELRDFSIVPGNDSVINGQTKIMSPQRLNSLSRDAVKRLNIEPDVIPLPDDFNGTTETNLAFYGGDIFAKNLKHQMTKATSFNEGEISYILGNKSHYTFYRHYCDLARSDSQLKLFQKLNEMWGKIIND